MSTIDIGHFPIMRFRQAFMALIGFGLVTAILVYLAVENEGTDAYLIAAAGTIVMGPVLVNAVMLVRHETRLDAAPPRQDGSRET